MIARIGAFGRRRFVASGMGLLSLAANRALGQHNGYSDGSLAGGPIAGPFRHCWESLKAYRYPDWFHDAKFGIWACWNCVKAGPKKDIVGTWGKIARAHGLKFGITVHGTPGRVWREFMPVRYRSDATGPLQGISYDGVLTKADGKGKWWDGMDPQQLNGPPHGKDDPCPEFVENFLLRVQDLIDKYNRDLLYFDDNCDWDFDRGGGGVWLGMPELTPHIMAYYYNANFRRNAGKLDAVFNIKNVPAAVLSTLVRDFEMSQAAAIEPNPFQTDACIGSWH